MSARVYVPAPFHMSVQVDMDDVFQEVWGTPSEIQGLLHEPALYMQEYRVHSHCVVSFTFDDNVCHIFSPLQEVGYDTLSNIGLFEGVYPDAHLIAGPEPNSIQLVKIGHKELLTRARQQNSLLTLLSSLGVKAEKRGLGVYVDGEGVYELEGRLRRTRS